jgi:predicted transcriptional regulator
MLVPQRLAPGIADGSVTVLLRRWSRRHAIAGHRYRTGVGMLEVDAVDLIDEAEISDEDARAAGAADAAAARAELRGPEDMPVTRVRFHLVREQDPRSVLAEDAALSDEDVAAIARRLERMDRASAHGPWTLAALEAIAANPEVRAGDLAEAAGRERLEFKRDIRKLKAMGLTLSFPVGYRLSPRGEAFLARR